MKEPVHKLIIKPRSAKTACGETLTVYYPMSNRGLILKPKIKPGLQLLNVRIAINRVQITCDKCLKKSWPETIKI